MAYGGDSDVLIEMGDGEEDEELMQAMAEAEARKTAEAAARTADVVVPELPDGKTHHLFISHSEEDGEWVEQLVGILERDHGVKCLWPRRDFTPGREVAHMIQSGIAHAMKVLFILTEASLESGWCKYERNWAFMLSIEERENRIIPLLLSQCEVPNIFRTINYIDVPKGEDYVFRIRKAFDEDDNPLQIIPNVEHQWNKQVNGLKRSIEVQKFKKTMCSLPSWRFPELDEYQCYKLRTLGSKSSDKVYNEVREIINPSKHMKRLGIKTSCLYCSSLYIFTVLVITSGNILLFRTVEIASNRSYEPSLTLATFFIFFLCSLPVIWIAMCCYYECNYRKVKERVFTYSLETVAETSLLLKYNNATLEIMYYDINPCVNYIRNELMRSRNYFGADDEDLKKKLTLKEATKAVLNYIRTNYDWLFNWDNLDVSEVNRHATFANKKCVCEMLERVYWHNRHV